ncbi:hypothetical protein LVJ94_35145 [Pendulispora rubella]|uniref:Knr4/Smi1-like domain-containing protein n=1 Tax=Pendulispora rubella TaxID=2741070 RepID=A0ABZ2KTZ7_9BACT
MAYLTQLCALSKGATAEVKPDIPRLHQVFGKNAAEVLEQILGVMNGLYAFEDALHVFSDWDTEDELGIYKWNNMYCWRIHYSPFVPKGVCFAEDLFGNQFVIGDRAILLFDAESGKCELFASTLEEWARRVIREPASTGFATALAWREACGPLRRGQRLVPKVPFLRGKDIPIANLEAVDGVEAMQTRGARARAIFGKGPIA